MGKTIVLIHGRNYKPEKEVWVSFWKEALYAGIHRDYPAKVAALDEANLEYVYYGSYSNEFLSEHRGEPVPEGLTDRQKCLRDLKNYRKEDFNKENYEALPGHNAYRDDVAHILATVLDHLRLGRPLVSYIALTILTKLWIPGLRWVRLWETKRPNVI